jgi:hypothetical protein
MISKKMYFKNIVRTGQSFTVSHDQSLLKAKMSIWGEGEGDKYRGDEVTRMTFNI